MFVSYKRSRYIWHGSLTAAFIPFNEAFTTDEKQNQIVEIVTDFKLTNISHISHRLGFRPQNS